MADVENALDTPAGTEIIEGSEPSLEPIEATTVETTGEPGEVDTKPEVKGKAEERIGTLTRKWRESQQEAAYWKGLAEGKKAPGETQPDEKPDIPQAKPKPRQADFENYDDYVEALTDWKTDERLSAFQREASQKAAGLRAQDNESQFQSRLMEGAERYEDFDDIARNPILPITPAMIEVLKDTELPADIAYYLGKNIKECTMISRMPPIQAARVIGRIEAEIKSKMVDGKPPASPKPKTVSDAPPPVKPIGSAEVVTKDPNKMTQAEYERWRSEGGGK